MVLRVVPQRADEDQFGRAVALAVASTDAPMPLRHKKLHANQRAAIQTAIRALLADPTIGQEKKGDLSGGFVYKFDCVHQQFLMAYQWDESKRVLLAVGPHENFYRDLKR